MQKYSFKEKKDLIFLEGATNRPFKDKNGRILSGEELLKQMAVIVDEWERKNNCPVPIPEQNFIGWLKQAKTMLDEGKTSEEIFNKTLVRYTLS